MLYVTKYIISVTACLTVSIYPDGCISMIMIMQLPLSEHFVVMFLILPSDRPLLANHRGAVQDISSTFKLA